MNCLALIFDIGGGASDGREQWFIRGERRTFSPYSDNLFFVALSHFQAELKNGTQTVRLNQASAHHSTDSQILSVTCLLQGCSPILHEAKNATGHGGQLQLLFYYGVIYYQGWKGSLCAPQALQHRGKSSRQAKFPNGKRPPRPIH